jgi:DNA-binding MarR family transcriptional regulator
MARTRLYDEHLGRAGLTTTQFSILRTVQRNGGRIPLVDLAADLVFERTSLYRALRPLRRAGLVRLGAGLDRRARHVTLTPRADRCIDRAMPHWAAAQRLVLDGFGAVAWSTLARRLGALAAIARVEAPR